MGSRGHQREELMATLHAEIGPHLAAVRAVPLGRAPTDVEIAEFAELSVRGDVVGAVTFIGALLRDGMSVQGILLLLLAPAARRLGEQVEVTEQSLQEAATGLDTIQQIIEILLNYSRQSSVDRLV